MMVLLKIRIIPHHENYHDDYLQKKNQLLEVLTYHFQLFSKFELSAF